MFFAKCVNIRSFLPAGKLQLPKLFKNSQIWTAFVHISYTKCHPNPTVHMESVCTHRTCVVFTVLISVKFAVTQWIFVGAFCTKFRLNLIKKCRNYDKILFASINKVWLSLSEYLWNCHCGTTFKELLYQIKWKSDKR